jgi:hypothetical protein
MTETKIAPEEKKNSGRRPGVWEQMLVTLKILMAAGAVFGGIWLLESIVGN